MQKKKIIRGKKSWGFRNTKKKKKKNKLRLYHTLLQTVI